MVPKYSPLPTGRRTQGEGEAWPQPIGLHHDGACAAFEGGAESNAKAAGCLTRSTAHLGVHSALAAHKGCKVRGCPVGIQIQHQAPEHLLRSLCFRRSRVNRLVEDRVEVDPAATIVQLRDDAERQELGTYRLDDLLLRFVHAPRV